MILYKATWHNHDWGEQYYFLPTKNSIPKYKKYITEGGGYVDNTFEVEKVDVPLKKKDLITFLNNLAS